MQHHSVFILLQTKVNGKDFFMFPHRIPVQRVSAIQVDGDVSIQTINIIGVSRQVKLSHCIKNHPNTPPPQMGDVNTHV